MASSGSEGGMRHRKLIVLGTLLAAACAGDRGEVVAARSALTAAFPDDLALTGCGAGDLLAPGAGTPRSFPVQDLDGVPGVQCPGCVDGQYTLAPGDWAEVLGLIYAGLQRDGSRDCNGDLRRSLVASWGQLFPSGCGTTPCPSLARAWRPGDLSPAAASLLSGLGLSMPLARGTPGAQPGPIPFCNAHGTGPLLGGDADYLDGDPIRVDCPGRADACGPRRHLGLVTVVEVPSNLSQSDAYPGQRCGVGQFKFVPPALFQPPPTCPMGQPVLFGKCFLPVINRTDGTFTASCIAWPPFACDFDCRIDHRAHNTVLPAPSGLYRRDSRGRLITGSYYRMHTLLSPSGLTCTHLDSNEQIGCLSQAGGCTLGFAAASPP